MHGDFIIAVLARSADAFTVIVVHTVDALVRRTCETNVPCEMTLTIENNEKVTWRSPCKCGKSTAS